MKKVTITLETDEEALERLVTAAESFADSRAYSHIAGTVLERARETLRLETEKGIVHGGDGPDDQDAIDPADIRAYEAILAAAGRRETDCARQRPH